MCARFQVTRSSLSEKKKQVCGNFTHPSLSEKKKQVCGNFTHPSPRERSRNQNTSLGKVVKQGFVFLFFPIFETIWFVVSTDFKHLLNPTLFSVIFAQVSTFIKSFVTVLLLSPFYFQSGRRESFRNSHHRCSVKKVVLKNFAKFTGKHLCLSLLFNKVAGLIKKEALLQLFSFEFCETLRTPFLQNASRRLLLNRFLLFFCYFSRFFSQCF